MNFIVAGHSAADFYQHDRAAESEQFAGRFQRGWVRDAWKKINGVRGQMKRDFVQFDMSFLHLQANRNW